MNKTKLTQLSQKSSQRISEVVYDFLHETVLRVFEIMPLHQHYNSKAE